MADVDFDDFEAVETSAHAGRAQRFINLAGAATSLALVIGVGVWGYRLAVRDVSGIPVVRALEGPMRVAPSDPGGEVAAHQGLAVNAIAAEGTAAPTSERLVLAPRPIELSTDDQPGPVVLAEQAAAAPEVAELASMSVAAPAPLMAPVIPVAPVEMPTETPAPADTAAMALVADALAEGVAPLTDLAAAPVDADPEPAPPGAVTRSLRPMKRPAGVLLASAAPGEAETVLAAASVPVAKQVDPGSIEAGTRLVQLGAFDDEAGAIAEWDRLQAQFGDLITGKSRVIQTAQSGGRTFIRLRAHGFADEDDARRFCSALLAENAACIPVAHRP